MFWVAVDEEAALNVDEVFFFFFFFFVREESVEVGG